MLSKLVPHSLSRKLILAILAVSAFVTTFATLVQLSVDYKRDLKDLKTNIELVEKSYKKTITNSVWEFHSEQLRLQLEGVLSVAGIQHVVVKDQTKTIAEAGLMPEGDVLTQTYDLIYDNSGEKILVGQLAVYAGKSQIWDRLYKKVLFLFFIQFLKSLLVSVLFYMVIQRLVTRHLVDINKYLKGFDLKTIHHDFKLKRSSKFFKNTPKKDELDTLADSINQMRHKILHSYTELDNLNHNLAELVEDKTKLIMEQRQRMEFSAKMTSLGEMAGGIAHEINSPLAALSLGTELLLEKSKDPNLNKDFLQNYLLKNQKIILRIAKIVNGLKTFSRNGDKDKYEDITASTVIENTVALCRDRIDDHHIKLNLPPPSTDFLISCRSVEISQVLLNLLGNSLDAVLAYEQKWIQVDLEETEKDVLISVTDCGPGVSAELRQKIFEPFFTTKDVGKGTGLGLSISKSIVKSHGGDLYIDDTSPHTRFVIAIPKLAALDNKLKNVN